MAVVAMDRILIGALKRDRKRILELLQRQECVEISEAELGEGFERMDTDASRAQFERVTGAAAAALRVLDRFAPAASAPLAFLNGRKVIGAAEGEAFAAARERHLAAANRLIELDREIEKAKAQLLQLEADEEALRPWLGLPVPQAFRGTPETAFWAGSLQGKWDAEQISGRMAAAVPSLGPVHVEVVRAAEEMTSFYILALRGDARDVDEALSALGFIRPANPSARPPTEALAKIRDAEKEMARRIECALAEIRALASERDDLKLLADHFSMRREKYLALSRLAQSPHAFVLVGYVPSADAAGLRELLLKRFPSCHVEIESAAGDANAPTKLKNRPFAAATEVVLENYNLPTYTEIDPSPVMSFFYYFLFGLMLSDAGYGAIMAIVCALLPRLYPNMEGSWRKSLRMYFWCGMSTVFWGILFSSYFGDVVSVVSETFFHRRVEIPPLWFAPLEQPMRLLIFCLGLGVVHLTTGYVMKALNLAKDRQHVDILYDSVFPIALLAGLLVPLMGSDMFRDMAGFSLALPGWASQAALGVSGACAVGVVLTGGRESRSWGKRILKGLYALYNVIAGWLSDILSYSRLLALGLATGVIASVFNSLGAMVGTGVIGAIAFIVIFLVGQALNMGINILGAYVHSNRLEYVEFFGKFYDGNGRKFSPLGVHTKYYRMEKEI